MQSDLLIDLMFGIYMAQSLEFIANYRNPVTRGVLTGIGCVLTRIDVSSGLYGHYQLFASEICALSSS